jgi:hypothetical protein
MTKESGYNSHQRKNINPSSTALTSALQPTKPMKWVTEALSLGLEADHSSLFRTEVKKQYSYVYTPPSVFMEYC